MTKYLPFPPFEPDKSPFNMMAADAMLNVLPAADGWKPMPSLVEVSDALPSPCVGAAFHKDATGSVSIIAATQTNLYKLNGSSWDEVSKSTDAYSVPTDERVSFVAFGNYIFVNNLGTTPQKFLVGTDTLFSDNADMPQAKYMWNAGEFVICGHLVNEPDSIQWSGINDGTFWTVGERGSDKQQIPSGGEVQGGVGSQRGAVVILRDRMVYMQFSPESGFTFVISPANDARGCIAPLSIAQIGPDRFVYMSEDGFFEGVEGIPIGGEKVDAWFQHQADIDYIADMRALVDPFEKIVWFKYRKTDATTALLGWDWQLNRWCVSDQDLQEAAALATAAETWDSIDNLIANWGAATISWDSRILKGGRPTFGAFTTENKLAFFAGSAKAATLETASVELNPTVRSFVNGGRLIGDVPTYTAQIGTLAYHGDSTTWKSAVSPSARGTGLIPFRAAGRLHRARINIAASETWNIVSGIYVDGVVEGES